jgi:hypothetical protein
VSENQVRFEDFVIQFDTSSRGGFRARVLKSPFGEGVTSFSLPAGATGEAGSLDPSGIARSISSDVSRDIAPQSVAPALAARPPLEIGTELYRSIFQGQVRSLLDKCRGQLELSPDLGLRLKIKLDPSDEETGALADLPWELLCDGETEDFFALSRRTSLVRYLDVPRSSQPIPFTAPLRILAVGASPRGMQPLDLEEESRRLEELNRSSSGVEVQFLPHASAGTVREALSEDTYNVLHFMGHGTFDRASGEGMLAFEDSDGSADLVSGKGFATKLRDLRSLGVVVLNACNTARAGHHGGSPFRGVATALVLGGVPAVVAMQRPISDRAAIGFSTAFYRHLARGDSIDVALTEGRQAIHSAKPDGFEWATPVLFLRMPEGNVFVAKPAEPAAAVKPAVEVPVAAPPPLPVQIVPVSPKRGLMIKIGTVAAGVVLVIVISWKVIGPSGGTASLPDKPPTATPTPVSTPAPSTSPGNGRDSGSTHRTGKETQPHQQPFIGNLDPRPHDPVPHQTPATTPVPVPTPIVKPPEVVEAPAPAADLSSLSAQLVAIEHRGTSVHVTVSFKNTGSQKFSVILDRESSNLSDGKSQYSIQKSSLPSAADSNLRLDLAPGAGLQSTFDFQAPQLGGSKPRLYLVTVDDRHVDVSELP